MIRITLTESEFDKVVEIAQHDVLEIDEHYNSEYSTTWYLPYEDILFETHKINDKYLSKCEEEC